MFSLAEGACERPTALEAFLRERQYLPAMPAVQNMMERRKSQRHLSRRCVHKRFRTGGGFVTETIKGLTQKWSVNM